MTADDPLLAQVLRRTESDLAALLIRDEDAGARPFVAAGAPWFMTLFGRDSLLTAWMALPLDVGLSIGTLQRLARLQGRRIDPMTEEQPGRILHELRRGPGSGDVLDGVRLLRLDRRHPAVCHAVGRVLAVGSRRGQRARVASGRRRGTGLGRRVRRP